MRCDDPCRKVTIDPSETFTKIRYAFLIEGGDGGASDAEGAPLASDKVWSFTTGRK